MLNWLSRDGKILLASRPFQSFSASFVSIFLAVYLSLIGIPLWQIGLVLTGGLLCSTAYNTVAGFINLPRSLTSALGPSISGFVMQFMGQSLPFLVAGGLKAAYDLALFFMFRDVKPPEENRD